MHPLALLIIIASTTAKVKAICYTSGDDWGSDQGQANAALEEVCSHLANSDYKHLEERYFCVNADSGNKKLEFWIKCHSMGGKFVDVPLCVQSLGDEINGCSLGGASMWMSLFFRADPNPGRC
ncbi:hypothetical protein HBI56_146200 [Parastagonospora nodorum]|uniref:Ecp2 effector protein domain-containing protein n=1 Tax=Phaeosphaeria nodorum (strain SN15 / ATCC MYA-4574 / FGSC 10173) TaxID=321614 RepID=A0A7U2IC20_PHANO|nr:hypothetical protein HBH56_078650 [Parastagonospora nodorum]QRD07041.1 hypothetical protein JI435_125640 [Parastagonospora nodorum SN15]KAH3923455.1 hypothetical protein HBH54_209300 [Parastagonospora nodorum]KAH3952150.1 hypothetical protein HBH53_049470 [Parastagonospora nodorum]KAH3981625.1 hypothetical protein HBH51_045550 [Parastagonospora nodorum]